MGRVGSNKLMPVFLGSILDFTNERFVYRVVFLRKSFSAIKSSVLRSSNSMPYTFTLSVLIYVMIRDEVPSLLNDSIAL
ncbi:hypothetical protein D9M68_488740 [compost metagenome]